MATNDSNSQADILLYDLSGIARYRISGNVGVPFALVSTISETPITVQADAGGNFVMDGLAAGAWQLRVTADGYDFTNNIEVTIGSTDITGVMAQGTLANVRLTVDSGGLITSPENGINVFPWGSYVKGLAAPSSANEGQRIVPVGWVGSGSVPSQGSASTFSFWITTNSSLTWAFTNQNEFVVTLGEANAPWGAETNWVGSGAKVER